MRNILKTFVIITLLFIATVNAQAPQKMSYQAVIRNASGTLVSLTPVGIKISILQGSVSGASVYVETHSAMTSSNGLISIEIGGGNVQSGSFTAIAWANGPYFVKTETDPTGGSNYTISGTSQLLSVPYALYAENTKSQGKSTIYLTGDITDAEAALQLSMELGPSTQYIYIVDTTALTTVDLSGINTLINLTVTNNTALTTLTVDSIQTIYQDLVIQNNPALVALDFSGLVKASQITVSNNTVLTTLIVDGIQIIYQDLLINNNAALSTLNFGGLLKASQVVKITGNGALTSLNFASLTSIPVNTNASDTDPNFSISNPVLSNLDLSSLQNSKGLIRISGNGQLLNLTFPSLISTYGLLIIGNTNLLSVNFPALVNNNLTAGEAHFLSISNNPGLLSIDLPVLNSLYQLSVFSNPNLATLNIPAFAYGNLRLENSVITTFNLPNYLNGSTSISVNSQLTSVNLPNYNYGNIAIFSNPILTSISIPAFVGTSLYPFDYYYFKNNNLPSSQVNSILNTMVNVIPLSGKEITLKQLPPAPPTGQGIIDKATLVSNGNLVITD